MGFVWWLRVCGARLVLAGVVDCFGCFWSFGFELHFFGLTWLSFTFCVLCFDLFVLR